MPVKLGTISPILACRYLNLSPFLIIDCSFVGWTSFVYRESAKFLLAWTFCTRHSRHRNILLSDMADVQPKKTISNWAPFSHSCLGLICVFFVTYTRHCRVEKLYKLIILYSWQHINESKLLHTYVMNEFLAAYCSYLTKYFWKTIYKDL